MLYSTTRPDTSADPDGETTTTSYEPGGSTASVTTPAGTTTTGYDAAGDVTSTTYSDTGSGYATPADVNYTYFQDGSRRTMTDGTGTTTYAYDDAGDTTSEALVAGSGTGLSDESTSYGYDAAGQVGSITYPSYGTTSDPTATYSYNDQGQMASLTDWSGNTVTFAYDADGNETNQANAVTTDVPGGTSSSQFSFDAADQNLSSNVNFETLPPLHFGAARSAGSSSTSNPNVSDLKTLLGLASGSKASSKVRSASSSHESETTDSDCTTDPTEITAGVSTSGSTGARNADGQITQSTVSVSSNACDSVPATMPLYYSYDAAGRVTYEAGSAQGSSSDTITYDPAGNIETASGYISSTAMSQSSDAADEVTSQDYNSEPATISYDTIGDQTANSGTSDTYDYDQTGDLTSASVTGSGTSSYLVNGDGLDAATTVDSTVNNQFVWNDATSSLPLIMSDGTNDFLYGPSTTPVEQFNITSSPPTDNPIYINYAPNSGISLLVNVDIDGTMVGAGSYDPYALGSAGSGQAFGYQGEYTDGVTGQINMRARWYQSTTGTFTSVDPALTSTNQPYQFANGDPVNASDPLGEDSIPNAPWVIPPEPRNVFEGTTEVPSTCASHPDQCGQANNSNNDGSLFVNWVLGLGTQQQFNQWDPLTQNLMHDPHQVSVLSQVQTALSSGGPYQGDDNYYDPHVLSAFVHDMLGFAANRDDADAFLGSYNEHWWLIPNGEGECSTSGTAYFRVTNVTNLNSFVHPEVTTGGLLRSINGIAPWLGTLAAADPFAFRPQTQTFQWARQIRT